MPGTIKISQLTEDTTPLVSDMIPIVDETASQTKRVSVANLLALLSTAAGGFTNLPFPLAFGANNGNKEITLTTTGNLTTILNPGMKLQVTRNTTPPTQCMAFAAASSQYATKASPSGINFTGPYTTETWIYLNSYTGSENFVISRNNSTGGFGLTIDANGRVRGFYGASSSFTDFFSYQSIPLKRWVHIAVAVTSVSSKTASIYINGTLVPSFSTLTSATTLAQQSVDLRLGASNTPGSYLDGYLSETRMWSVAQSQSSIRANMAINLVGIETNLVTLYKGNGAWTDATTNANTLSPAGGASDTQAANPYSPIEYGIITVVSYSNPTTTITVYTGNSNVIPNATLTLPFYSVAKTPFGFPCQKSNWRLEYLNLSRSSVATSSNTTWYNANDKITVPSGSWNIGYSGSIAVTASSTAFVGANFTMSTANNTESDRRLSRIMPLVSSSTTETDGMIEADAPVDLSSTTDYFFNGMPTVSTSTIFFGRSAGIFYGYADCGYL